MGCRSNSPSCLMLLYSSRKYPYLPHRKEFFLMPPPPTLNSNIHFFKFSGCTEVHSPSPPSPPPPGNSSPLCGESLVIIWNCGEVEKLLFMYGLLTKCEVKLAGYWPSSFFCMFMDRDGVEVHKHAKKERGQYQAILTEQAWSMKHLLYGFWGNFSCETRQVVLSGQDGSILPVGVANHSAGFDSSCLLTELAI